MMGSAGKRQARRQRYNAKTTIGMKLYDKALLAVRTINLNPGDKSRRINLCRLIRLEIVQ